MALQQNDPKTIEGKQAITTELLPILNQIENKVVQDHYAHKLARSLSVQPDIITQEMDRVGKSSRLGRLAPPKKQLKNDEKAIPRPLQFSDELLHLTLSNYSELDLLTLPISDFPINAATKVLKKLADVRPQDLTKFAKALSPELQETFDNAYLREETVIPEANKLRNRWQKAISDLAILHLRDKLRGLRAQFKSEKQDSDLGQKINQVLEKLRFYES
jgi:DNA primase